MKTTQTQGLMRYDYSAITKQAIADEVTNMLHLLNEGEIDPVKAISYLTGMERVIKEVKAKAMDLAIEEFDKYGEKAIVVLDGCNVSKVEAGVRYDFSNTEKWNQIKASELAIANERKELEKMLKVLKAPMMTVDPDTGEAIQYNPPIKTSTTTLKIVIK